VLIVSTRGSRELLDKCVWVPSAVSGDLILVPTMTCVKHSDRSGSTGRDDERSWSRSSKGVVKVASRRNQSLTDLPGDVLDEIVANAGHAPVS
jgi:hypothetical protein